MDYIILGSRYFGKLLCEVGFDFVILVSVHRVLQICWCVCTHMYIRIYTRICWGFSGEAVINIAPCIPYFTVDLGSEVARDSWS